MWPFKRIARPTTRLVPASKLSYSQVDCTEGFDDNLRLGPDDWIRTLPLDAGDADPESMGLPPRGASVDQIYLVASRLSGLRESIGIAGDGVYCPICHIANTSIARLRAPCPKCGRALLQFGWT